MNNNRKYFYVDIFAGASGLAEGFYNAGFLPVAHVERDSYACLTIKTRTAYHYCVENNLIALYKDYYAGNLTRDEFHNNIPFDSLGEVINDEINESNFSKIISQIESAKKRLGVEKIDLLLGGPPCQAYSVRGRKANESKKKFDERIYYYKLYAKFLRKLKPKIFVFENVPGLLSFEGGYIFDDLKAVLKKEGYEIDYKILSAYDFGVLQDRKRIVIIGWQKEFDFSYPEFSAHHTKAVVNDLLSDLPARRPGDIENFLNYTKPAPEYLSARGIRNGLHGVAQHITRPHNKIDLEIYRRVIDLWNRKQERLKYSSLPARLRTHRNIEGYLDRFKVVAGEANYAHTIIAHIAKDGHYYIHPDINQCRSISVREAARIQSFPDNFIFEGPRTSAFTQIGNAVPPVMAHQIAMLIKKYGELNG